MTRYVVRQTGRTWGIFDRANDQLVEGGFFQRPAAENACDDFNRAHFRGNRT